MDRPVNEDQVILIVVGMLTCATIILSLISLGPLRGVLQ